ncbi:MAG: hypothetical protein P0119_16175 [Nitrospira sp.]|nr:hypothetical protein [Nitrospira sp.]
MTKAKAEALELIRKLPDDMCTGTTTEELCFKEQVERGLKDVAQGRVLSHNEVKERIGRWRTGIFLAASPIISKARTTA